MSNLYQNTIQTFLQENVKSGEIHLLISGTLGGLATPSGSGYNWDAYTGSWKKNQVDATGSWIMPLSGSNTGSIQPEMYLTGLAISAYVSGSGNTELAALQKATRLIMNVEIGSGSNSRQTLDLNVKSRQVQSGYIFLEVEETPLPLGPVFNVYFKYSGSSDYRGYTSYPLGGPEINISLLPYIPPADFDDYNPIYNNAIDNTKGTIARVVELGEQSSSMGTIRFERATVYADIPDSFYTSIANASGRWLGTKNAEYSTYLGNKLNFTENNIKECNQDIQQNVKKGVYLVYQGSPYVLTASEDRLVDAEFTGNIKGTVAAGSKLSGSIYGTISGSLSGSVTEIQLVSQSTNYYSSSVNVLNHEVWAEGNVDIKGTGTIEYGRWMSGSESQEIPKTAGAGIEWRGLVKFDGQCGQGLIPNAYITTASTLTVTYTNVSGNVVGHGTILGSGQVNYTGSQRTTETWNSNRDVATSGDERQTINYIDPNLIYLKNVNLSRLAVDNITYGDIKIISTEPVYISGTVGNIANNLILHNFTGLLSVENGVSQEIAFEHADADGIVMSDVEVVEGSTTVFSSFTANSIAVVQNFRGRTGLTIAGGQINVISDRTMYVSLTTEDQEDITEPGEATGSDARGTGSLPSAISRFMDSASGYSDFLMPSWSISTIRKDIVGDIKDSVFHQRDNLAQGTAIVSGSFQDFIVQGTRKDLRRHKALPVSGSSVRKEDIVQAMEMLTNLEAGLAFAKQAYYRPIGSNNPSVITPRIVSKAVMPQKVFDTMMTASNYIVPNTDGNPVWDSASLRVPRNFDFFNPSNSASIQNFMTGSKQAIERLGTFLSGSLLDSDSRKMSGQYTYVYLSCTGIDYLRADIQNFTGSYIEYPGNGGIQHTTGYARLSGSYRQIWGKFGEGAIIREHLSIPAGLDEPKSSTNGVIYGAFDFKGYVDGGYEGNMVEGTIEGDLAGILSGLVSTGSIEGGPVQLTGVNRGIFSGTVKAGTFEGTLKNLSVTGNNLMNNLYLEGQIRGIEEFPLDGIITGSVVRVTLPGRCTYEITASNTSSYSSDGYMDVHIPQKGYLTGRFQREGFSGGWTPRNTSGSEVLTLNLAGERIDLVATQLISSISGSVTFGESGTFKAQDRINEFWSSVDLEKHTSNLSGQFEIAGETIKVTTPKDSLFSGKVGTVVVNQPVSGNFDVTVQSGLYSDIVSVDLDMTGSLENFKGHVLAKGLLNVKSGTDGNLVEGHDRPFFTLQSFSGSIFPEDTLPEAVLEMNISDMVIENLGFTSGMSLIQYSTGSFGRVKEQEYVQNALTLPQVGDIIYTSIEGKARVVSSKLYCPDLNALLTVNDRGTVVSKINLAQVQ